MLRPPFGLIFRALHPPPPPNEVKQAVSAFAPTGRTPLPLTVSAKHASFGPTRTSLHAFPSKSYAHVSSLAAGVWPPNRIARAGSGSYAMANAWRGEGRRGGATLDHAFVAKS